MTITDIPGGAPVHLSTLKTARLLGLAVRSVQLMVDRGELDAWKTPGGHRRITRESVARALQSRQGSAATALPAAPTVKSAGRGASAGLRVLLIEDSKHFQTLIALLLREQFPDVRLDVADDGIVGLAMAGELRPQVLVIDILLPGIDGATLITSLRSHPQFASSRLIVVTSLAGDELAPYRFALKGVPIVHKSRLVAELPALLAQALALAPKTTHASAR